MLDEKPAASVSFLDPEEIFRDLRPLPEVPKDLVEGITLDKSAAQIDLKELVARLEKHVFRAKLLLDHEEELLDGIKRRSSARPDTVNTSAKLNALHGTRNELIAWMEAELGKASADGGAGAEGNGTPRRPEPKTGNMTAQLAMIKEKYARYLVMRKALVQDVGQAPQPVLRPASETETAEQADTADTAAASASPEPQPTAHLLTPSLESLLQLSHQQKGMISGKSHVNMVIAKQLKENCQVLDHLAEESQLLPSHSAPGAHRRKKYDLGDGLGTPEALDATSRVKPWVFAADSAKIATLETVTEHIDEGGLALEDAMKTLEEVGRLLGLRPAHEEAGQESSATEDDIWLAEGRPGEKSNGGRKHTEAKGSSAPGDVWDMIRGNLGLLGPDESPQSSTVAR
ncbi:hypothetical protein P8C59_003965 [Phyllachora maydis]|uniref:Uncharacterized protein n=1 Tax=Phyllachora maydis TaxID=1825666 RepID=A0AAD9I1B1_9PEZI|nr:hypothetical protein P8C59_003965 [Phyllachora maydis]